MSHIPKVGRNSWKVRAGLAALYAILVLGAVTTVYPFLLMVSTAMKSHVDYADYSPQTLIPRYLYDDAALFTKYVEDRYANNLDEINAAYDSDYAKPGEVSLKATGKGNVAPDTWNAFVKSLPLTYTKIGFGEHDNAPSQLLLLYRETLRKTFNNDIAALNAAWTEENISFDAVVPPFERVALREWTPDLTKPKVRDWYEFRKTLPEHFLLVTRIDPVYRKFLRENVYEDNLDKLNAAWKTSYKDWSEITLPKTKPTDGSAGDWETFVRTKFPLRMLGVNESIALPIWRQFLAERGRPGAAKATLPDSVPLSGEARTDYMEFIASSDGAGKNQPRRPSVVPVTALVANSPENLWRDRTGGASVPQAEADAAYVLAHKNELRSEFATRNFRAVLGYILLNGRAVWNTILFCLFAIAAALIVNPMCAYALSRYPLPYTYKVLLFLLATMAFPAEVAMIPNFLLLKELGMLNTFWALVLPGLANGFSIFLLKGFFDSLPKELYEAGILDGASEITMFRQITVPLSLPIFSVIALNSFTASYGAFLFAMVVCQNPKMWTLMVFLYNLQDKSPQYVIMAALTLAAIPTLIVFLLAQKVILRGIILPSFK